MKPYEYTSHSARFFVYGTYIVAEPLLYTDVYENEVEQLYTVVSKNITGDFGLIENRINQSSIHPLAYCYAKELMPGFSAFALVAYNDVTKKIFKLESTFIEDIHIKSAIFFSLADAKEWMDHVLSA